MKVKDHVIPLLKEESKETDKKIEEIIAQKLTREKVMKIFDYGAFYHYASGNSKVNATNFTGQFPCGDYNKSIDFVYRLIVENERDEECLRCKRYYSGSCDGTINRGREVITIENMCGCFIERNEQCEEESKET